jgi:hypothetical protein
VRADVRALPAIGLDDRGGRGDLGENTGVGREDWTALARLFIERLGPDKVSYAAGA